MQVLVTALQGTFDQNIKITGTQWVLYVLVQYASSFGESELIEKAKQAGVKIYPTAPYFSKDLPSVPFIQLGFSGLSPEQIRLGVHLLKEAWT